MEKKREGRLVNFLADQDRSLEIIWRERFESKLIDTLLVLKEHGFKLTKNQSAKFMRFLAKEFARYISDEIERYGKKKRNKKSVGYIADIGKAYGGDIKSLCRIISWDKAWLFTPWVKERVLQAQEGQDTGFLKDIGDAIAAEQGINIPITAKDKQERKLMMDTMRAIIPFYISMNPDIERREVINSATKAFWLGFREKWDLWISDEWGEKDIVLNIDSFRQYLKRQKVY